MDNVDRLKEWLRTEGRKKNWLAAQVHVHATTLTGWLNRTTTPQPAHRIAIEQVTEGAVKSEEWT